MFCPKCGSIMMPKALKDKKVLACSCGHKQGIEGAELREKAKEEKKIEVVEEETPIHPLVDQECPKCKHGQAFTWEIQTRAADEAATKFFQCEKCKHTWREYR